MQKQLAKSLVSLPAAVFLSLGGFFAAGSLFSAADSAGLTKLRGAIAAAVIVAILAGTACVWLNLRWHLQAQKQRQARFAIATMIVSAFNLLACAAVAGFVAYVIARP